jgi:hypothetical protein
MSSYLENDDLGTWVGVRSLADNSTHCVGNCGVEDDRAHPHACQIHPHPLTAT